MSQPTAREIEEWLVHRLAELVEGSEESGHPAASFESLGLSSMQMVGLAEDLSDWLGRQVDITVGYDHPTPRALADALAVQEPSWAQTLAQPAEPEPLVPAPNEPPPAEDAVALVGMSCRFPGGANSPEQFWKLLEQGYDATSRVPADRWAMADYYTSGGRRRGRSYTERGAFVDDVAGWDADFFGLSPQEALRTDPAHRLALELAWEALEDAGIDADRLRGSRTGVFLGLLDSQHYLRTQLEADPACHDDPSLPLGVSTNVAGGRLAYLLDLRGPAVTVDTACSSSLVALHLAAAGLRRGEYDLAVVVAASATVHPDAFVQGCQMSMLSPDGRCKTFDARADGYALGEGGAALVLEPMSRARRRRCGVRATVLGSAVNQDGRTNGLTAPSQRAQVDVIRSALRSARVGPEAVGFVEAHGTGTELGDMIELRALQEVFRDRGESPPLPVGAVKSNVGHLLAASGMAGLVKTVLALEDGTLPRNINYADPSRALAESTVVRPVTDHCPFLPTTRGRVAGVSSFGWSGTNAHVVLEEAPTEPPVAASGAAEHLLPLSAATPAALRALAAKVADFLEERPDLPLADIAYTLQVGRARLAYRQFTVCGDRAAAVRALRSGGGPPSAPARPRQPRIALWLPGTQRGARLDGLLCGEPVFRDAFETCARLLAAAGYGDLHDSARRCADASHDRRASLPATLTHPVSFAMEYALARLLQHWGLAPDRLFAEGTGRRAADCLSGLVTLPEALQSVMERAEGQDEEEDPAADPAADSVDVLVDLGSRAASAIGRLAPGAESVTMLPADPGLTGEGPLHVLGRLWQLGADIDWAAVHGTARQLRRLPRYPFQRTRFWPEAAPADTTSADAASDDASQDATPLDIAQWCHVPGWDRDVPAPGEDRLTGRALRGTVLVFDDGAGICRTLARRLRQAGNRVVTITPAEGYRGGGSHVELAADDDAQYQTLIDELLPAAAEKPWHVVHAWSLRVPPSMASTDRREEFGQHVRRAQVLGFHSLLRFVRALGRRVPRADVRLLAVIAGTAEVAGEEASAPERATVAGLVKTIPAEHPGIRCRCVDLPLDAARDEAAQGRAAAHLAYELSLLEPAAARDARGELMAWRGGHRWLRGWKPLVLGEPAAEAEVWREEGTYLITGGTRGIGLMLARHLAREGRGLALVGRTELPPRSAWARAAATDDPVARTIKAVRELEARGAQVLTFTADVGDEHSFRSVLRRTREHFGALHGVVHAAGVPGGGLIQHKTPAQAEAVLGPKVYGTLPLLELLDPATPPDERLELLVLYSSAVTELGGLGESDYCAANAFLDACATSSWARGSGSRVLSVAWGPWQHDAWQAGDRPDHASERVREYRQRYGIAAAEGTEVLGRALTAIPAQVMVLPQPLAAMRRSWARLTDPDLTANDGPARQVFPRPELRIPFVPVHGGLEGRIAAVWRDHLGVDPVGALDPFFELGGNSMLGMAVVARLGRDLGTEVLPAELFAHPTVRDLALALASRVDGGEARSEDSATTTASTPAADRGAARRANTRHTSRSTRNRG
ncbi:SDR family NAD(P)-dependent oxidoreductase [Streptomyces solisilvae]|uniref:type I polyketide synthase n=1 Tax=Streptomyces malaysiensis TaxID=92644 RepID=UPI0036B60E58